MYFFQKSFSSWFEKAKEQYLYNSIFLSFLCVYKGEYEYIWN